MTGNERSNATGRVATERHPQRLGASA
jgi:hypothetical protein